VVMSQKVRVFGFLKKLFLKRFTVRSTTRTLITDKNDHSAFTAIIDFFQTALHVLVELRYRTILILIGLIIDFFHDPSAPH
jgi:hypothetical protein